MVEKTRGFTLVELMVVIAIIGILAGIIVASTLSVRRIARDRKRVADLQLLHGAMQAFRKESPATFPPPNLSLLVPTYLSAIPTDPLGASYFYEGNPPSCPAPSYALVAALETSGITDARNDSSCWSGANDDMTYVIVGR